MNSEFKRKIARGFGTLLVLVGVLAGLLVLVVVCGTLLTDGIGGADRRYPGGIISVKFILEASPFIVGGIISFVLGMSIRDNNVKFE
jgi:hypothetical protein